ncbi:MAG: M50 family metallopeptidase, partial [bacterium]
MEYLNQAVEFLRSPAAVIVTFGLVIFLHEFGHFIVCKLSGIKVERFSFGLGPEMTGFTRGGTRYSISVIPLGGYVKPAGESPEEMTGDPGEYFAKPWYVRLAVVVAGPLMNYLLAFLIFTGVIFLAGQPVPSRMPVIGETMAGYPAAEAGIRAEDRILKINGAAVTTWENMASVIHRSPGKKLAVVYSRSGIEHTAVLVPVKDPSGKIGLIGIFQGVSYQSMGFINSVKMGAGQCWYWTTFTFTTLASKIYHRENPDLAGPVGIVTL